MSETGSERQLGNFTAQAAAYSKARPTYPPELIETIRDHLGVARGDEVVDLGAGTGIFSRQLIDAGLRVVAVEPNDAMRRQAEEVSGVRWTKGTFEETGLDNASTDWICAAQSFHWAEPARALPELARVLRPGGGLTVIWNNRDEENDPHLARLRGQIERLVPEFDFDYRTKDWETILTAGGLFRDVVFHEARHVIRMTRESFLELWRSQNMLTVIAGPERMRELSDWVRKDTAARETIDVPYHCVAWTARLA
ncbi:hypothetical protein Pan216_43250 [Planctomycetes bacterium Pan216]|uniref:Methyltransferase type 11 domain-containing protein n=1 Tax=Kolteria novifilia TaxID=2527975 RepID=A0A518B8Z2_9BACT|nr:hypothetical protein Pan216_43250 [Planctomycetes bacterium Pan216]